MYSPHPNYQMAYALKDIVDLFDKQPNILPSDENLKQLQIRINYFLESLDTVTEKQQDKAKTEENFTRYRQPLSDEELRFKTNTIRIDSWQRPIQYREPPQAPKSYQAISNELLQGAQEAETNICCGNLGLSLFQNWFCKPITDFFACRCGKTPLHRNFKNSYLKCCANAVTALGAAAATAGPLFAASVTSTGITLFIGGSLFATMGMGFYAYHQGNKMSILNKLLNLLYRAYEYRLGVLQDSFFVDSQQNNPFLPTQGVLHSSSQPLLPKTPRPGERTPESYGTPAAQQIKETRSSNMDPIPFSLD
jgi:hypothetical protein